MEKEIKLKNLILLIIIKNNKILNLFNFFLLIYIKIYLK